MIHGPRQQIERFGLGVRLLAISCSPSLNMAPLAPVFGGEGLGVRGRGGESGTGQWEARRPRFVLFDDFSWLVKSGYFFVASVRTRSCLFKRSASRCGIAIQAPSPPAPLPRKRGRGEQ